jgi:hypothetical protein
MHNQGEKGAETGSSQAPTSDHLPLLFDGTCRVSGLHSRNSPGEQFESASSPPDATERIICPIDAANMAYFINCGNIANQAGVQTIHGNVYY